MNDTFENCMKEAEEAECLGKLFEVWKRAHIAEDYEESCKRTFPFGVYSQGNEWFKGSFNRDGILCDTENDSEVKKNCKVIFLVKESNASDDIKKLQPHSCNNFWFQDVIWKNVDKGTKYYNCLTMVRKLLFEKANQEEKGAYSWSECAYVNINKRGGNTSANQACLLNYAEKYKTFILRQLYLITKDSSEKVYLVICGKGGDWASNILNKLFDVECLNSGTEFTYKNTKYEYINITHPSVYSKEKIVREVLGK